MNRTTKPPEIQRMLAGWIPKVCTTWRTHEFPEDWIVLDTTGQSIEESVVAVEAGILSPAPEVGASVDARFFGD